MIAQLIQKIESESKTAEKLDAELKAIVEDDTFLVTGRPIRTFSDHSKQLKDIFKQYVKDISPQQESVNEDDDDNPEQQSSVSQNSQAFLRQPRPAHCPSESPKSYEKDNIYSKKEIIKEEMDAHESAASSKYQKTNPPNVYQEFVKNNGKKKESSSRNIYITEKQKTKVKNIHIPEISSLKAFRAVCLRPTQRKNCELLWTTTFPSETSTRLLLLSSKKARKSRWNCSGKPAALTRRRTTASSSSRKSWRF